MVLVEDAKHFQFFAAQVKDAIEKYGTLNDETLLQLQRERVDGLSALEVDFKQELLKHPQVKEAFDVFYDYILVERKNLLSARPFFRERHEIFGLGIMESIRTRDYLSTCKYNLNYHFISILVKRFKFEQSSKLTKTFNKILGLRQELVLMNLPLVISRARIFFSKTPKSHLSFMDLVQIGVGGLLSAIDKYCGQYARVWRGVVIGRISGDYIARYNETFIHFYPDEKRALYRAHKFMARNVEGEYQEETLLAQINGDNRKDKSKPLQTKDATGEEVRNLLLAASIVSCDTRPPLDDEDVGEENVNRLSAPADTRPDVRLERAESLAVMFHFVGTLTVLEQKILKLKGLDFDLNHQHVC